MDISRNSRAPLAERPLTTVRIYTMKYAGLDTPEKQKVLFDNLDRFGAVDEVWLSTLEGNNSMADHRKFIENLKYTAGELRKRGILVSIQLSSCVGHFGAPLCEDGFPWTDDDLMVDSEGRKVDGVCCLTGEAFTAWTGDVLALYCRELEIHAAFIDDDVRFHNHGAVQEGCFCRRCLERFAAMTGRKYTREELARLLNSEKDSPIRRQWVEFHTQEIARFCGEIARRVHAASPNTVMGLQTCHAEEFYNCWDFSPVYRAMAEATGHPARVRVGGGAWYDFVPTELLRKPLISGCDASDARECGCVDLVTSEMESCPCTVTNKSAYSSALEAAMHLAYGCTSVAFQSGPLWYSGEAAMEDFFRLISQWRGVYEKLAEGARKYRIAGLNLVYAPGYVDAPAGGGAECWWLLNPNPLTYLQYIGLPVFFSKRRQDAPGIITENSAMGMDRETLARQLKNGLLLSGNAFLRLSEAGLMDFTGVKASNQNIFPFVFHEHDPLNGAAAGRESACTSLEGPCVGFDLRGSGARVLATYDKPVPGFETAAWALEGEWGRLAVIGYPGEFTRCLHTAELGLLRNIADWLGKEPMPLRLTGFETLTVVPETDDAGRFRMAAIVNCGIAPRENIRLEVRRPAAGRLLWLRPGEAPVEPEFTRQGETLTVTLPRMDAWGFGLLTAE